MDTAFFALLFPPLDGCAGALRRALFVAIFCVVPALPRARADVVAEAACAAPALLAFAAAARWGRNP